MKTNRILMLGLVLALPFIISGSRAESVQAAVVPFRAYYPVTAVQTFNPECGCIDQVFTPGGDGHATHMGLSQFSGQAQAWMDVREDGGLTIIQKGTGTLTAADGDDLTVYYEGKAFYTADGQHIICDGWYIVKDGTGRFKGMTGGGNYRVFVYVSGELPNDLWFDGVLQKK